METTECFNECHSGVVQICLEREGDRIGSGSGFLVEGGIITNSHVIRSKPTDAIAIRFNDSEPNQYIKVTIDDVLAAESTETERDYAFLRMREPEFAGRHHFSFSENENVAVGQMVAFLGFPFGMRNLTLHVGYISSIYENRGVITYQIDGSINGGNSGGPLLSLDSGRVIGIVTRAQTGLIEDQFRNLIDALKRNQEILSKATGGMTIEGIDPIDAISKSQRAMEQIAVNLRRSANVGIGYAFSSEYVHKHLKEIS